MREYEKPAKLGIPTFLILGTFLVSGCSNTGPASATPVATPAPRIVHTTVPVSPTATKSPTPAARYRAGDIVWRNDSNYDTDLHRSRGMIILQVNEQSYNYQYVSKDDGDIFWS